MEADYLGVKYLLGTYSAGIYYLEIDGIPSRYHVASTVGYLNCWPFLAYNELGYDE